ncbi:MAG: hypothetical protein HY356_07170 [Gammaproteobacteria bacterium]|nr:hypothetical protein [Gammaproteobacteria bacterium]
MLKNYCAADLLCRMLAQRSPICLDMSRVSLRGSSDLGLLVTFLKQAAGTRLKNACAWYNFVTRCIAPRHTALYCLVAALRASRSTSARQIFEKGSYNKYLTLYGVEATWESFLLVSDPKLSFSLKVE